MDIQLWDKEIPMYDPAIDTPNSMTAYPTYTWFKVPTVVVLAGGGYVNRVDHEGEAVAKFYQDRGMNAFVVHYRLAPYAFPAALMDVQRAIKILKKNADLYKVDENRLFVIGFSAGGHLATCVATMEDHAKIGDEYDDVSPSVSGVILGYPVTSALEEDGPVTECVAQLTDRSRAAREALTTYRLVNEKTPPCFIWHTSEDEGVDVTHSLKFADALHRHKIPVEMHIFPKGRHGLGLAKTYRDLSQWPALSAEWILNNF